MRTKILAGVLALVATGAAASAISSGGTGGGSGAAVDVLAALVGQNVNANSYTATTTVGPGFQCTGDMNACVRLGTAPRATIGPCTPGAGDICIGPNDFGFTSMLRVWGNILAQGFVVRDNIDIQGSAYIINNAGAVTITDTDGLVINGGTPLKGRLATSVTFDSAAISNNTCNPQTVSVTGAVLNDFVQVNANFALPVGVAVQGARVTAANTVELNICNNTSGGSLDPASGPYLFLLER